MSSVIPSMIVLMWRSKRCRIWLSKVVIDFRSRMLWRTLISDLMLVFMTIISLWDWGVSKLTRLEASLSWRWCCVLTIWRIPSLFKLATHLSSSLCLMKSRTIRRLAITLESPFHFEPRLVPLVTTFPMVFIWDISTRFLDSILKLRLLGKS